MFSLSQFEHLIDSPQPQLSPRSTRILEMGDFKTVTSVIDSINNRSLIIHGIVVSHRLMQYFVSRDLSYGPYYVLNNKLVPGDTPNAKVVSVCDSHEKEMRYFTKDYFDVFARGKTVKYDGRTISVRQYNFYRWVVQNCVLEALSPVIVQINMKKICYGHKPSKKAGSKKRSKESL